MSEQSNETPPAIALKRSPWLILKRLADLVLGIVFLLILSPILLISALIILVTDPGPVFFRQVRLGLGGKTFSIFKFRSMVVNAPDVIPNDSKVDPRITRIGNLLRKTKIDELPQLLNVVAGHMSLVGPRPLTPTLFPWYTDYDRRRLSMKPGITGLQQIEGGYADVWADRIEKDLEYINRWNLWLDLTIIVRTPTVLLGGSRYSDPIGYTGSLPTAYLQHLKEKKADPEDAGKPA